MTVAGREGASPGATRAARPAVPFVTGIGGFVGRRVAARIAARGTPAVALIRSGPAVDSGEAIRAVRADLLDPAGYEGALRGCDVVVHLAAATGRASPAEHHRVNVDGTRALLGACERAGVRRFVFVSSIAAGFPDTAGYPYARSKIAAEECVRTSGLDFTIVRPTMIFGPDSPVLVGLRRLAAAPVMPVFGGGRVLVQPIWVEDVAELVLAVADDAALRGDTIELGGPDRLPLIELLRRIRLRVRGRRGPVLKVPIGPMLPVLAVAERVAGRLLPFTIGQLATFRFDGTARDDGRLAFRIDRLTTLEEMLDRSFA